MPALTEGELIQLEEDVLERIESFRITQEEYAAGMGWYHDAHGIANKVAKLTNVSTPAAAGIIAALSPRVRWHQNVKDAANLLNGDTDGFSALGANIVKAWTIMEDGDPDVVLGGSKVRAFWRNIAYPLSSMDVTLDVWMLKALVPEHWYAGKYTEPYNFLARKGVYDTIAGAVREAAWWKGIRPHELQAALWLHVRDGAGLDREEVRVNV